MEKAAFLEEHVFTDLKKIAHEDTQEDIHFCSEIDFQTILQRVEHCWFGLFTISSWLDSKALAVFTKSKFTRKTTDANYTITPY